MYKKFFSVILIMCVMLSVVPPCMADSDSRMNAVLSHIENMMKYGRYNENTRYPNLMPLGINAETKKPVVWKMSGVNYNPANFMGQQNFVRSLVALTVLTGEQKYRDYAEELVSFYLDNLTDKNGLIYMGEHAFVDLNSGKIVTTGVHENKDSRPYIEFMYEVEPEKTIKYLEAFWNAHVLNMSNLAMSRHGNFDEEWTLDWDSEYTDPSYDFENGTDDVENALAFQCTANDLILSAFFIAEKTGDSRPVVWAKRMMQKYIDHANPVTGLGGAQYGILSAAKGGDRAQYQMGEDFGELAYEYNMLGVNGLETSLVAAAMVILKYVETSGDPDTQYLLDYFVKAYKGLIKYVYDPEKNNFKTPMFSDGTSLQGYTLKKNGYYGAKGDTFSTGGDAIPAGFIRSAVYLHKLTGEADIWEFARSVAKGAGLGDIGTAPGKNVAVNKSVRSVDPAHLFAMLDLYKATGCKDYLDVAERIGDMMAQNRFSRGMFVSTNRANSMIDTVYPISILNIEAAKRGIYDTGVISNVLGHSPIDMTYDGVGRVQEHSVISQENYTAATEIHIPDEVTIPYLRPAEASGDALEKAQSLGFFTSKQADDTVSKSEFIAALSDAMGFSSAADFRAKLSSKVRDSNFYSLVNNALHENVTVEKAGAMAVGALTLKRDDIISSNGFLGKYKDAGLATASFSKYTEMSASLYLIGSREAEYLTPTRVLNANDAAQVLLNARRFFDTETVQLVPEIMPTTTTDRVVTYVSSDEGVVKVDAEGRLYAIAEGTATIEATCGKVTDTCIVHSEAVSEGDVRDVWINGDRLDNFSPFSRDIVCLTDEENGNNIEISARTYSGEVQSILKPQEIPGTAQIETSGDKTLYNIYFEPSFTGVYLDEDMEAYDEGMPLTGVKMDECRWAIHPNGQATGISPVVVTADPLNSENKVAIIPYNDMLMEVKANITDRPILTGAAAVDDKKIVIEYSLMTTAPFLGSGLSVRLGHVKEYADWAGRITYMPYGSYPTVLANHKNGYVYGEAKPGVYHNVKWVFDKATLQSDVYLNGTLVGENQPPLKVLDSVDSLMFHIPTAAQYDGTVYIDNLKIYEMENDEAELLEPVFKTQSGKVSYITNEQSATVQVTLPKGADANNLNLYVAYYSVDKEMKNLHVVKNVTVTDDVINAEIDTTSMSIGDYAFVYVWRNGLAPASLAGHIYRRNSVQN